MQYPMTANEIIHKIQSSLPGIPRIGIVPSMASKDKWTYFICVMGVPRLPDVIRIDATINRYTDFILDVSYVQEFAKDMTEILVGQLSLNEDNPPIASGFIRAIETLEAVLDGIAEHGVISLGRTADAIEDDVIVGRARWKDQVEAMIVDADNPFVPVVRQLQ
jgi:hypothetical protein